MFTDRRGGRSVTHSRWDMHKFFSVAALAAVSMLLGACGGSSFQSSSSGSGGGSSAVASLAVTSDVATIPSDGSSGATITVVAKDANNNAVSGATISFAANNGGNVTATQGTTDTTGTAKGTLVVGTATAGATITVTASAGGVSGKTTLTVSNTQKTLTLLTSLPSIPSDGSKTATITAYVRDANNNFVSGQAVGFQATSGGLTITQGTTDANGMATATLSSAGDSSNRTITVTAQAGTAKATVDVTVSGTKLTLSGPANLVMNSMGTYSISLTDAAGAGIANQTVNITSAKGNTVTPTSYTSDSTGQKTFTLNAINSGADTLTVTAGNLTATEAVNVSSTNFTFTAPDPNGSVKVNIGTSTPVVVNWKAGGVAQAGKTVSFSATRGTLSASSAVTDASGNASVTISSTQSGPSVISATATDTSTNPATTLNAQTSLDFLATTPSSLKAQASPSTIPTQGTSTITVTVRDAANNLVEGKTVNFSITQDVTGGSLSVASATTDAQGQASTVYTASNTTSASNGVVITAAVSGYPSATGTASLTVAGQTVFLSLGTGNQLFSYPKGDNTDTEYKLPYSVQAVDNAGHGVNNVPITFTVTSLAYNKGFWVKGTPWTQQFTISQPSGTTPSSDPDAYTLSGIAGCKSEDVNHDGIYVMANDYNGNGHLDPGLVASTDIPSGTTSNAGSISFNIIYPKDHAEWVAVRLTATATVAGTQSSTYADFWLPIAATDISSPTVIPPGAVSPYGIGTTCLDPN